MSDFAGFAARDFAVGEATIFARVGGSGPPLLLLHGYPQSHVMWARVAAELAARFTVVAADLRGYGRSSAPASQKGDRYSKRVMAQDVIAAMSALGHEQFGVVGHDRGGRVAYRLALDHPEKVTKIAVLDIVPTWEMWAGMDAARAMSVYHWMFLAQPEPLPETLINPVAIAYLEAKLASWTGDHSLKSFAPTALEAYREAFRDPARCTRPARIIAPGRRSTGRSTTPIAARDARSPRRCLRSGEPRAFPPKARARSMSGAAGQSTFAARGSNPATSCRKKRPTRRFARCWRFFE
jgi:pimeloyl-ACP methyl ester carboxylesterase